MDLHDLPYYGKSEQVKGFEGRDEAKDGTMRFYRVAASCASVHGQRMILGLHFVLPKEETVEVLADLWLGLRQRGPADQLLVSRQSRIKRQRTRHYSL